ncbi:MAG: glyoxalase, partial [Gimesia sp.]|nr:glyoxalase [Gimesia sp.]
AHVREQQIAESYGVTVTEPEQRPWRMRDFVLYDPSGVLWRIAENTD